MSIKQSFFLGTANHVGAHTYSMAKVPSWQAWTLGNLAHTDAESPATIAQAGAIQPLVDLVRGGSARTQENAAWLLVKLAHSDPNRQVAITQAGAIKPLVALMRNGSPAAREQAACYVG